MSNKDFYLTRYPNLNNFGMDLEVLDSKINNYVDFRCAIIGVCGVFMEMYNDSNVDSTFIEIEDLLDDIYFNIKGE